MDNIKRTALAALFCCNSILAGAWGQTGHRTVAQIAQNHLTKKAKKKIAKIMGHESLVEASTWMDNIKSDDAYDHTHSWHYVTVPDGQTYANSEKNEKGDAYECVERMIETLKDDTKSYAEKKDALRMLVHVVGDFHQPLHVGKGDDRGGNDVKIKWFYSSSNLHSIWDSKMIDSKNFSYSELALMIDHPSNEDEQKMTSTELNVWVSEAQALRTQIYYIGEKDYLSYEYLYKNWPTVKEQLYKGGRRLAAILNELFS